MKPCTLRELVDRSGATLRRGVADLRINRLHTDTRTIESGDCFVALKGEKYDGNDYLVEASERGAVAALVSRIPAGADLPVQFGLAQVPDTLLGFQKFAADYRSRLKARVIAVTGSSGKTSTKEMTANILRQNFKTLATKGNLNNHIGVPQTLLTLTDEHEFAVIEMGMNHPGELAPLVAMATPQIAIITNIGTAHIEFFQDQQGIALEKATVVASLPEEGVAILNADDPFTPVIAEKTRAHVVLAGLSATADWRAENIVVTADGIRFDLCHEEQRATVTLPLYSRPMVVNALLAAAAGNYCGASFHEIVRGLETVELPAHRMAVSRIEGGRWIINDAYNANLDSMKAALQALKEFPATGRKVAVLGSMGELGAHAVPYHRQVGAAAAKAAPDYMIVLGPNAVDLAQGAVEAGLDAAAVFKATGIDQALAALREKFSGEGDCVLVKGSRFMQLEKLVQALSGTTTGETH